MHGAGRSPQWISPWWNNVTCACKTSKRSVVWGYDARKLKSWTCALMSFHNILHHTVFITNFITSVVLVQKIFTPVVFGSIESNSSSFPPLVRIIWAGVNTAIALGCGLNNCTETQLKRWSRSSYKWTLVRLNGWTNEWMTLSTPVVLLTISGSLAKRAVWQWTAQNKQKNLYCIWSGPKQVNLWTFLMWIHP